MATSILAAYLAVGVLSSCRFLYGILSQGLLGVITPDTLIPKAIAVLLACGVRFFLWPLLIPGVAGAIGHVVGSVAALRVAPKSTGRMVLPR